MTVKPEVGCVQDKVLFLFIYCLKNGGGGWRWGLCSVL